MSRDCRARARWQKFAHAQCQIFAARLLARVAILRITAKSPTSEFKPMEVFEFGLDDPDDRHAA